MWIRATCPAQTKRKQKEEIRSLAQHKQFLLKCTARLTPQGQLSRHCLETASPQPPSTPGRSSRLPPPSWGNGHRGAWKSSHQEDPTPSLAPVSVPVLQGIIRGMTSLTCHLLSLNRDPSSVCKCWFLQLCQKGRS